ncbi:hypothetical protein CKAN_00738900 [Cinnamomum micranthum f. kanehirae]|uniref:Uncharacterized protein n=1 Tax=Cinnamomum micranthum f. kanehirae TaxID=337451 RepID=A0A3S3MFE0_9MAGN|nr:hypothetical protein CKAN_00738900 [Cinnamomum micranthum f. kanehirae]
MEFGEASKKSWETDYHAIQCKVEEKGRENGVLLVGGFSKNLLNIFLDNGGVVNPEEVMEEAIAGEVYKKRVSGPIGIEPLDIESRVSSSSYETHEIHAFFLDKRWDLDVVVVVHVDGDTEYITMSPPVDPLPSPTTSQNHLPFPAGKPPSPFRDAMNALFNNLMGVSKSPTGFTENLSPTFLSSGNPCMDFFFYVMPGTRTEMVTELLWRAWVHDPLTTLKLICQLRKVGEAGKSDKEGFYTAVCWLHQNHPKTLALNVGWFAQFGYMKDLLEILFRQLGGPDARKIARLRTKAKGRPRCPLYQFTRRQSYYHRKTLKRKRVRNGSQEERILAERERVKAEMEKARELRKNRRTELARRVVEKYYSDSNYRFLHDKISEFFAESLKSDIEFLNSGEYRNIGLAAKWCPSLNSSFDRSTLLCESIAKLVFPRESDPSYSEIEEAHYSYRVRDRLRKEILVPLRKSLKLPEVYMSSNRWGELPYERVPPLAMKRYKKIFEEHDRDRFWLFGMNKSMRMEILAARALLPHEIIFHQCYDIPTLADVDKVTELQWKRMVEDLSKKGKLRNILCVCQCGLDGKARRVSIAFGLLTSELSEEPWRGNVINFCEDPQLHRIQGETLREKVKSICRMKCWHKTDFLKVFDRILDVAVAAKLEEEKMVKRVLVFSYSDFDRASTNSWDADYAAIKRKYEKKGYGSSVPEIVFWNLRYPEEHPRMPRREKGVALVRGFSRNLLNNFLHNDGVVNAEEVMEAAIAGEEYQKLRVFD